MKKILPAIMMFALVSCSKNLTGDNELNASATSRGNSMNAESAQTLHHNTKFGCLLNGDFTPDERASVAKSLNVKYVRDAIVMDKWKGKSNNYDAYTDAGIKVVLNINYKQPGGSPQAFPKDMNSYRKKFNDITNTYQPPVVAVENEEINVNYHKGPMSDYISMLKVALDVCHSKGIKVTNGGIYGGQLDILTYRYLQTKGQKRADSFANNCMENFQIKAAQNPGSNPDLEFKVRQLDTLLNFYDNLDYVNIHVYEPFDPYVTNTQKVNTSTPVVIPDIQEYLKVRTGRPVITNETGQRDNTNPDLVTSMLQLYDHLNFPYVIWFSGEGGRGAQPLYDLGTGKLYPNGIAFATFMAAY